MAVINDDLLGESLKGILVSQIAHKIIILQQINNANRSARRLELFANALAYSPCTARNYYNFIFEIEYVGWSFRVCLFIEEVGSGIYDRFP